VAFPASQGGRPGTTPHRWEGLGVRYRNISTGSAASACTPSTGLGTLGPLHMVGGGPLARVEPFEGARQLTPHRWEGRDMHGAIGSCAGGVPPASHRWDTSLPKIELLACCSLAKSRVLLLPDERDCTMSACCVLPAFANLRCGSALPCSPPSHHTPHPHLGRLSRRCRPSLPRRRPSTSSSRHIKIKSKSNQNQIKAVEQLHSTPWPRSHPLKPENLLQPAAGGGSLLRAQPLQSPTPERHAACVCEPSMRQRNFLLAPFSPHTPSTPWQALPSI